MSWLTSFFRSLSPQVTDEAERIATLKGLEHGCGAVRDDAPYATLRYDLARSLGCRPERLTEVLTVIGDAAHDACP